jgi:hypothetical protein
MTYKIYLYCIGLQNTWYTMKCRCARFLIHFVPGHLAKGSFLLGRTAMAGPICNLHV